MAIRPPSAIRPYHLIYSGDPSLTLAPIPPAPVSLPDESDADLKTRRDEHEKACAKVREENGAAYTRALESGDWSPILRPGEAPTKFLVRQVPGSVWRTLERAGQGLGGREWLALIFRVAVIGIENGPPGHAIELEDHRDTAGKLSGLGPVLPVSVVDALDAVNDAIVNEIAGLIMSRRMEARG